ncbi:MAG: acyltransferase family protein [Pirellula sp.]|nr:acyltransferase family protein [Pirellula sp.]
MSSPTSPTERRHDLDALRASAMMLGIVYHGALSLALGFPWFVQDPSANGAMYVFQSWVHGFRMPLFFIISGFFTAMLWKKRGALALVSHRFRRVFLPCLVGSMTLVPLCNLAILKGLSESNQRRLMATESLPPEQSIWVAIQQHRSDAVRVHLENGTAFTDLHPQFQTTVLSWAAIQGDLESVRVLIEMGCDPSLSNPDGNTALHASMFFGNSPLVEYLLEQGADITKRNSNGETPINSLRVDTKMVQYIGGLLSVRRELADIKDGRALIENALVERNLIEPAKQTDVEQVPVGSSPDASAPTQSTPRAIAMWLATYPAFSFLWFLWFLWWFAVFLVILQWVFGSIRSFWSQQPVEWSSLGLYSPVALLFWMLVTMVPLYFMGTIGFIFGPDTSVGLIPAPQVFAYYAVFFLFGVGYYLGQDTGARLGQSWRWLLPWTMLVLFPIALEINLGKYGLRDQWIGKGWVLPLSVLSQSLFAWCMSISCIGLFRSCVREQTPWIRYLSDSSYWLYVAHLPLVIVLQSQLAWTDGNAYLKLLIISFASIGLLLLSYQLLVRNTWLGVFLNGRRAPKST